MANLVIKHHSVYDHEAVSAEPIDLDKLELSLEALDKFLDQHANSEWIGDRLNAMTCPVARMVKAQGYRDMRITVCQGRLTISTEAEFYAIEIPGDLSEVISRIDASGLNEYDTVITTCAVRRLLNKYRREVAQHASATDKA